VNKHALYALAQTLNMHENSALDNIVYVPSNI